MADVHALASVDAELLAIFFQEAREQIDTLDQGLVRLEREPQNATLMQDIFRAAHTLKGSSGALGLRQMAETTHALEDVLDRIRQSELTVTPTVMDTLLRGLDLLKVMLQAFEEGQTEAASDAECTPVVQALHALVSAPDESSADAASASDVLGPLPDGQVALLVNLVDDCAMPSLRAEMVLARLAPHGPVLRAFPDLAAIQAGQIEHRLLLVLETSAPEDTLRASVMGVGETEWVRIARGAAAAGMRLNMPAREERVESLPADDGGRGVAATGGHQMAQQTVRVSVDTLDDIMNLVGEMVLDRTRVTRLAEELRALKLDHELLQELDAVSHHLGAIVGDLHERVLHTRMLPVSQLFNRFPRLVRDLCRTLGKEVQLVIEGEHERLDRSIIEKLVDPLTHILRNSVDHGMEMPAERETAGKPRQGTVRLAALRSESHILIIVQDDGPGIAIERVKEKALAAGLVSPDQLATMARSDIFGLIFASGLSTAAAVSDVSGRGVGMDVVKRNVEALGGTIQVDSERGLGTTITLKIPLTLAIVRALITRVGQVAMAIPLSFVEETIKVPREAVHSVRGRQVVQWRDQVAPVIRLTDVFPGCGESPQKDALQLVTVRSGATVVCLAVDGILGHQEIVVKSLGEYLGDIAGLAGSTILGNGRVALIIDVSNLFEQQLLSQAIAGGGRVA